MLLKVATRHFGFRPFGETSKNHLKMQPLVRTSRREQSERVLVLESQIGSESAPILEANSGQKGDGLGETVSKLRQFFLTLRWVHNFPC